MAWIAPKAQFRKWLAANFHRLAVDEGALVSRSGAKPRDATLEAVGQQGAFVFVARESASPHQHDDNHYYQDEQKCSSSNKHGFLLSLGKCRVLGSAVRPESTLGLDSVSGSIGSA
jgi:hypothetical protein